RRLRALEQKISVRFGDPLPLAQYQTFEVARLSDDLVRAYRCLTDLMVTHLAAAAVYELLAAAAGTDDVQRLLGRSDVFEAASVHAAVARLIERVRAHPEHGRLDADAERASPEQIVHAAARAFAACHRALPFELVEGGVKVGDVGLLYFYRNRTRHLGG
ncbi:MAG: phospholipid/glycerol acyltransferase, partial [Myxococcaceae bacterium]|nr:phospholipid/glycerol acyltransferase [Myxococcaceae bacterium]